MDIAGGIIALEEKERSTMVVVACNIEAASSTIGEKAKVKVKVKAHITFSLTFVGFCKLEKC